MPAAAPPLRDVDPRGLLVRSDGGFGCAATGRAQQGASTTTQPAPPERDPVRSVASTPAKHTPAATTTCSDADLEVERWLLSCDPPLSSLAQAYSDASLPCNQPCRTDILDQDGTATTIVRYDYGDSTLETMRFEERDGSISRRIEFEHSSVGLSSRKHHAGDAAEPFEIESFTRNAQGHVERWESAMRCEGAWAPAMRRSCEWKDGRLSRATMLVAHSDAGVDKGPHGTVVLKYGYDAEGRASGWAAGRSNATMHYEDGLLKEVRDAERVIVSIEWNEAGRPSSISDQRGANIESTLRYDELGRLVEVDTALDGTRSEVLRHAYECE